MNNLNLFIPRRAISRATMNAAMQNSKCCSMNGRLDMTPEEREARRAALRAAQLESGTSVDENGNLVKTKNNLMTYGLVGAAALGAWWLFR